MSKKRETDRVAVPAWCSDDQAAEWARVVAVLPSEPVSAQQYQLIEAYVVERCRWLGCERYLAEHGDVLTLRTDRGDPKQIIEAPQVKISERSQDRMIKLGAQLGLARRPAN